MIINVSTLKRTPGLTKEFTLEDILDPVTSGKDLLEFDGPVKVVVKAVNSGGSIILTGDIKAVVILQCSRCLTRYNRNIAALFEREYRINLVPNGEKDNDDVEALKGDTIDITDPVMESILLELPMKQVCDQDCKGLCNICGTNLNESACNCKREDVDPRLEALKNFFKS